MPDPCNRARVSENHRIEIDEPMALAFIVRGNDGAHRELRADVCRPEILHPAAGMNPGSQHEVLRQRPIAQSQQNARMTKFFGRIERMRLADIGEVARGKFRRNRFQPFPSQGDDPY